MKYNGDKHINRRERIGGLIYVLVLFAIGVVLCSWLIFSKTDTSRVFTQKNHVIAKMDRQKEFRFTQEKYVATCDSLMLRIERFDPSIKALYEENDIKYIINDIKAVYDKNPWDKRYKAFYHMASTYDMYFTDKKTLWSKQTNVTNFKQNLEECELGLQKKKEVKK